MDMPQRRFSQGDIIFKEGDLGDTAYLVATGAVGIFRSVDGEETLLGEVEAGQLFGEMALIGDKPRTATARAAADCLCFEVPHKVFESELSDSSALMRSLVHNLIGHIRSLMDKLGEDEEEDEVPAAIYHIPEDFKTYRQQKS